MAGKEIQVPLDTAQEVGVVQVQWAETQHHRPLLAMVALDLIRLLQALMLPMQEVVVAEFGQILQLER